MLAGEHADTGRGLAWGATGESGVRVFEMGSSFDPGFGGLRLEGFYAHQSVRRGATTTELVGDQHDSKVTEVG
jgi:hypothetical protein